MYAIDLNCDLGEGTGPDRELLPLISSCNIACGGHYGDVQSIAETVKLAMDYKVKIGAHPSYPDRENFGRKTMALSDSELIGTLTDQIQRIKTVVEGSGARLHHVKPHGALYNDIAIDKRKAKAVLETVLKFDEGLILFVPPNSEIQHLANGKIRTWVEGFADRNYNPDFSLVPRKNKAAVLTEKKQILDRVLMMVKRGKIEAVNGRFLEADFETICVHGDTKNSAGILAYLAEELHRKDCVVL